MLNYRYCCVSTQKAPAPPVVRPSALQKHLQWEPLEGAVFRKTDFLARLDLYCFVSGKKYDRVLVHNPQEELNFFCSECNQGRIHLELRHDNPSSYGWIVTRAQICDCGDPPPKLHGLKADGVSALVGEGGWKLSDWDQLAYACFPYGYLCDSMTSTRSWCISCKRKDCDGEINIELHRVKDGPQYAEFCILSTVDCSDYCQKIGQEHDKSCTICCDEKLEEWVHLPCCSQYTCRFCLQKIVETGPPELMKHPYLLVVFRPYQNPAHRYRCPFCMTGFTPSTKIQHCVREESHVAKHEVEVRHLATVPYAYQSLDPDVPAHIATEADFALMSECHAEFLRQFEEEARIETAPTRESIIASLDSVLTNFE